MLELQSKVISFMRAVAHGEWWLDKHTYLGYIIGCFNYHLLRELNALSNYI